jgi:hypothetical protein
MTNNTTSNNTKTNYFAGELDAVYGYTCDTENCKTLATSVIWNAYPEPEQFACSTCHTQIIKTQTLPRNITTNTCLNAEHCVNEFIGVLLVAGYCLTCRPKLFSN